MFYFILAVCLTAGIDNDGFSVGGYAHLLTPNAVGRVHLDRHTVIIQGDIFDALKFAFCFDINVLDSVYFVAVQMDGLMCGVGQMSNGVVVGVPDSNYFVFGNIASEVSIKAGRITVHF